jgi:hypothetical protein
MPGPEQDLPPNNELSEEEIRSRVDEIIDNDPDIKASLEELKSAPPQRQAEIFAVLSRHFYGIGYIDATSGRLGISHKSDEAEK